MHFLCVLVLVCLYVCKNIDTVRTIEVEVDSDKIWKNPSLNVMSQRSRDFSLDTEERAFPHSLDASGLRVRQRKVSSWICGRMHIVKYSRDAWILCNKTLVQHYHVITLGDIALMIPI